MAETTLPERMLAAADTLAEVNASYGYNPEYGLWNPEWLRHEAEVLRSEVPQ